MVQAQLGHASLVSIHAPLRGATFKGSVKQLRQDLVSIHAPLRGATLSFVVILNPFVPVSIHAPLRGATNGGDLNHVMIPVSIHAPLRGATVSNGGGIGADRTFQSTHPCGVRHAILAS